jgi:hypothetical protein
MSMVEDAAAALYADWVAEDIGNEYCSWEQLGVDALLIELNPEYVEIIERRLGLGGDVEDEAA